MASRFYRYFQGYCQSDHTPKNQRINWIMIHVSKQRHKIVILDSLIRNRIRKNDSTVSNQLILCQSLPFFDNKVVMVSIDTIVSSRGLRFDHQGLDMTSIVTFSFTNQKSSLLGVHWIHIQWCAKNSDIFLSLLFRQMSEFLAHHC